MDSPLTSVRHFGALRVNGRRRDPVPAANSSAVVMRLLIVNSPMDFAVEIKCGSIRKCKSDTSTTRNLQAAYGKASV